MFNSIRDPMAHRDESFLPSINFMCLFNHNINVNSGKVNFSSYKETPTRLKDQGINPLIPSLMSVLIHQLSKEARCFSCRRTYISSPTST